MASLDDLKKRIASVKSTQKITKAMKMVAAAKLKRAQDIDQQRNFHWPKQQIPAKRLTSILFHQFTEFKIET